MHTLKQKTPTRDHNHSKKTILPNNPDTKQAKQNKPSNKNPRKDQSNVQASLTEHESQVEHV